MKRIIALFTICLCILCTASCASGSAKQLAMADAQYAAGEWEAAISLAKELITRYPDAEEITAANEIIQNANVELDKEKAASLLADAEAAFSAAEYEKAMQKADKLLDTYPNAKEVEAAEKLIDDAELAIKRQQAQALLDTIKASLDAGDYTAVMNQDGAVAKILPDSDLAATAKDYTAQAILGDLRVKLDAGDYTYVLGQKNVISTIDPDSEHAKTAAEYVAQAHDLKKADIMSQLQAAYDGSDWKNVQTIAKKLISLYPESEEALTAQTYIDTAEQKLEQAAIDEARSIIRVTKLEISRHDSAGGVYVYFNFINNSDKVISYVNFGFSFYNAVGDLVQCEIAKDTVNRCYKTGPYAKGEGLQGYSWHWGKYYNGDIASVKLESLSVEYDDGSKVTLTDDQIGYVQY